MSSKIRFAHLADLHLGGWREKKLTNLNFNTFKVAVDRIIEEKVDFCLFAGDIFNNPIPPIDLVNNVVKEFMRFKDANIPLYVIGGSHDYSNTGKSFLSILESAGVFIDVCKFEHLDKSQVKLLYTKIPSKNVVLSGILGKKNGLDKNYYKNIGKDNLSKDNLNIFLFHTTLNDFKPDFMKAVETEVTKSYLPEGFDYYAGGHVHTHMVGDYSSGKLSYPGPLFPNNFSEMKREKPSFNLCEYNFENRSLKIDRIFLNTYEIELIKVLIDSHNPFQVSDLISSEIEKKEIKNKLILLEISGIVDGKVSDIDINSLINKCYDLGAFHVLKNTYKLVSSELKQNIEIVEDDETKIEEKIIIEVTENNKSEIEKIKSVLSLDMQKIEGEKNSQFEDRVVGAYSQVLNYKNEN